MSNQNQDRVNSEGANAQAQSTYLRIESNKITSLLTLVGELGLVMSDVIHHPELEDLNLESFNISANRLKLLVKEIQDHSSGLSMVPMKTVFSKMRKLVRELKKDTGKDIELEIIGEDVEVDKGVLDLLQDPLIHLIRNSADHGLESDEERQKLSKGKGKITISAVSSGSEIHIGIADNGKGLNRDVILTKAIKKGLLKPDANPPDSQLWKVIFLPGFSTADTVSNLSGRGVGMDVVKGTLDKVRGRVNIESTFGQGTLITLKIPLTMAFLDCFIVRKNSFYYAIPLDAIAEVYQEKEENLIVSSANNSETIKIRGKLIRVVRLEDFYSFSNNEICWNDQVLVIVKTNLGNLCVPVDEVIGQQQVTMRPLLWPLSNIRAASGCAIMNTGEVAIALDCDRIIEG